MLLAGCEEKPQARSGDSAVPAAVTSLASNAIPQPTGRRVLSIVGTNDLHGHLEALPLLAGYVANLRQARKQDGAVLLVDGGDLFQGTLSSNLLEGEPVVRAYAAMGYHAVTVGNHEFDFGPVGPAATPEKPGDDPRGALKKRASEAPFPFLMANVRARGGAALGYANMPDSALVDVDGVRVGLIGVTTEDTLRTTIAANVADLEMAPIVAALVRESKSLRERGASVVVALAHAGGKCENFSGKIETDHCEDRSEIFAVAKRLPKGAIDAIVAGHTHAGLSHEVAGIPIIEQFAYGRAFGRIDLTLVNGVVKEHRIHPPQDLCPGEKKPDFDRCKPVDYEGAVVNRDARVGEAVRYALDAASARRSQSLGVELALPFKRAYDEESPLGNMIADLLRETEPGTDVAVMNGGGLRAELPAGVLIYDALFEAFPFDNRVAYATLTGAEFETLVRDHLGRGGGILSFSGVEIKAACKAGKLAVTVEQAGKPVAADRKLKVVGSDFLFTGGDAFWGSLPTPPTTTTDALMRDRIEAALKQRKTLHPKDFFRKDKRRLVFPGKRPIVCR